MDFPDMRRKASIPELDWETKMLKPGGSILGYVLAPVKGVNTHYIGGSRACRAEITKGRLPCPHCGKRRMEWKGYVPLLVKGTEERIVVAITEKYEELAYQLRRGELLHWHRPAHDGSHARADRPEKDMTDAELRKRIKSPKAPNITRYLLHLWQDPVLTKFFGFEHIPSNRSMSAEAEASCTPPAALAGELREELTLPAALELEKLRGNQWTVERVRRELGLDRKDAA